MVIRITCIASLLFLTPLAIAGPFVVDGQLDDWLKNAPTGSSSDWTPRDDVDIKSSYIGQDQTGGAGVFLGPGYGGQEYDAEAIYVSSNSQSINIAIVTGLSPEGPHDYPAGDIALNFSPNGDFGTSFEYGLVTLQDATGLGTHAAGSLLAVNEWNYGLWNANGVQRGGNPASEFNLSHPTTIKSGDLVTGANGESAELTYTEFEYGGSSVLGQYTNDTHYVIEAAIPWSMIDPQFHGQSFLVHWTMACANDFVEVDPPGAQVVPTPASALLLLAGLVPLIRRRRA